MLARASDWILRVDLKRQSRFPEDIVPTNLLPDIVILIKESRICMIMWLIIPWEEQIEEAHEQKLINTQNWQINEKTTVGNRSVFLNRLSWVPRLIHMECVKDARL